MWSGNLVPGSGFAFIINWGHSLIGGADYREHCMLGMTWANFTRFAFGTLQAVQ